MDTEIQTQQETSNLEAAPAQDTTVTSEATPDTSKPEGATAKPEDTWEYTGDRNSVPENMKKYVAALDRYVSKKDQSRIELEKKVKEYEQKLSSFQAPKESVTGTQPQVTEPQVTQAEAEAIMLGDANTLQKVIQRETKRALEADISPKEAAINQKLTAMEMKQKEIDAAEMIQSFAELHPDFWELHDNGFGDYMMMQAKNGVPLEKIYENVSGVKSKLETHIDTKRKADLEKKKAGSVVGKSIPGTPDVVYAENEAQAKKLAIELTLKGDKRHVRIKPKK